MQPSLVFPVGAVGIASILAVAGIGLLTNRPMGPIAGKWQVISVWGPNPAKLEAQEVRLGATINVADGGYLLIGRPGVGIDGMVDAGLFGGDIYRFVQNGTGNRLLAVVDGDLRRYLTLVGEAEGETIVAKRLTGKADALDVRY